MAKWILDTFGTAAEWITATEAVDNTVSTEIGTYEENGKTIFYLKHAT